MEGNKDLKILPLFHLLAVCLPMSSGVGEGIKKMLCVDLQPQDS